MEMMRKNLKTILIVCLISFLIGLGCAATSRIEIVDHTVQTVKMKAGQAYQPTRDGWFVSNEAMEKMLNAIEHYKMKWRLCEEGKGG